MSFVVEAIGRRVARVAREDDVLRLRLDEDRLRRA